MREHDRDKTEVIVRSVLEKALGTERANQMMMYLAQGINQTDLSSLLLWLYQQIVGRITPVSVLHQYRENRLLRPCDLDQRELAKVEQCIFASTPEVFSAIDLSPVAPLGINSVLARTSQKNVLSTVKNVEVVADVTTALAIECAERRSKLLQVNHHDSQIINLCTSQRSIRLQPFDDIPGFTSHFRVFGAASAGRDVGHEKFEEDSLTYHLLIYLDALYILCNEGYAASDITIAISDIRIAETIIESSSVEREVVGLNTQNEDFDLFAYCKVGFPSCFLRLNDVPKEFVSWYRLEKPMSYLGEIEKKALMHFRVHFPDISIIFDFGRSSGIGYYENLCFKLVASTAQKQKFPLADGGTVDWTKKLLGNKKERLFISGFGSELFCRNFKV